MSSLPWTVPRHFARNLNAHCFATGSANAGASGLPFLKQAAVAGWEKLGATHITQKDLQIGGVPGVETSYQLSSWTYGTVYQSQLTVLSKPGKVCYVTVTAAKGESAGNVAGVAAATARFP